MRKTPKLRRDGGPPLSCIDASRQALDIIVESVGTAIDLIETAHAEGTVENERPTLRVA